MTVKRTLDESQFDDWSRHPVTKALLSVLRQKFDANANELCTNTNLQKSADYVALRTAEVNGMQKTLQSFLTTESIKTHILDDDYVYWEK